MTGAIAAESAPAAAGGSVIKGSGFLIVARMVGMLGGFALFLLLTWRSKELAGIFRTAITFLVIVETLPLLGMHRWLATEMARQSARGYAIFRMANWFAAGVALVIGLGYLGIAFGGFYPAETSACVAVVALATVPAAVSLCVTAALVGIGSTHQSGVLSMLEMLARSVISIGLVLAGFRIIWVVVVFAVSRWIVAAIGYAMVRGHLAGTARHVDRPLWRSFMREVPNLALSMIGFLAIRNAALLLLPWFRNEAEAGVYAAPFQLFDLLLLVPTVLTISTNYAFVESAARSLSALRRSTNELVSMTALYVLPLVAVACVLARPMIEFVFGVAYAPSVLPFQLLLASAAILSLDQILALAMVTAGKYRFDRICVVGGGVAAVAATCLLTGRWGAAGAAAGLLVGAGCMLGLRLRLMRNVIRYRSLAAALRRQTLAALAAAAIVWAVLALAGSVSHAEQNVETLLAPLGCGLYLVLLYYGGGLSARHRARMKSFMARRG